MTSVEAARALGLAASTTRNAAAAGKVRGAYQDPRPGSINPPWVATEEAWQQWYDSRRPVGRPKQPDGE